MKRLLLILPLTFLACNTNPTETSDDSSAITKNTNAVDISMSAKDFTAGVMGDNYYTDKRMQKTIRLTGVQFGGTEKLGNNEISIWGNDGNVHWNGEYLCCRFIFEVDNPNEQQLIAAKGKYGTITGTLVEARDNESAPLGQTVLLKEFVFNNVTVTVDADDHVVTSPVAVEGEHQVTTTKKDQAAEKDVMHTGSIAVDKAYFYMEEDINTRRDAYLLKGQQITFYEGNGQFNIATYKDENGNFTNGWMLKSEIQTLK